MARLFANHILSSISWRLIMAEIIVILPAGLSSSWIGAAVQQAWGEANFIQAMLSLFVVGTPTAIVGGYVLLYPLERWVIQGRAAYSWQWIVTRILLYILAGLPIGLILLLSMRVGTAQRTQIVESSYFIIAVTNVGVIGLLYSFFERMTEEVMRREAQLKQQIAQLHIEIDKVKQAHQVAEITETEYFQVLRDKAHQLRKKGQE